MKRLSRKTYNDTISNADERKAVSLLVFIKSKYRSSVVKNFSYYKLSKLTGLHKNTIKKRLNTLGDMELLEFAGNKNQHLLFKSVRATKSNVRLDNIDFSSVKSIEKGLQAIYIVEIQRHKDYISHQVLKGTSPKEHLSKSEYKAFKKAKKFCSKNGLKDFNDNGISYEKLSKDMQISKSSVSEAINYGVKNGFFKKKNNFEVIQSFKTQTEAKQWMFIYFNGRMRLRGNDVISILCNTYSLPMTS